MEASSSGVLGRTRVPDFPLGSPPSVVYARVARVAVQRSLTSTEPKKNPRSGLTTTPPALGVGTGAAAAMTIQAKNAAEVRSFRGLPALTSQNPYLAEECCQRRFKNKGEGQTTTASESLSIPRQVSMR